MQKLFIMLALLLSVTVSNASIETLDAKQQLVTELQCGQTDSVRVLLDNSWSVLNRIQVNIEGTDLRVWNCYFRVSELIIPTGAHIKISVSTLPYLRFLIYYLIFLVVLILVITIFLCYKRGFIFIQRTSAFGIYMDNAAPFLFSVMPTVILLMALVSLEEGLPAVNGGLVLAFIASVQVVIVFSQLAALKIVKTIIVALHPFFKKKTLNLA